VENWRVLTILEEGVARRVIMLKQNPVLLQQHILCMYVVVLVYFKVHTHTLALNRVIP
jgi:hypothetical protein